MTKQQIIASIKANRHFYRLAYKLRAVLKKSISGHGNRVLNEGVLLNVKFDIIGNENTIIIQPGTVVSNTTIFMRGNRHRLLLGPHCKYMGGSLHFEDQDCSIELGEYTTVESAHLAVTEPGKKITIGKDCMLSTDVTFRTGDSHSILDTDTLKRINNAKDIAIADHVWIGANTTILKGVKIGTGSVISSSAVITIDVPANSIAGGIPGKLLKSGINWSRDQIYNKEDFDAKQ
jgi:carbonic anhydrase/acetyltransferase-like protein (isoleucine patch superfamily)